MRWKIDECPDANGGCTLREDDGTEHGDLETCIATVYGGEREQRLIESAPLYAEQVRILREVLIDNLQAWEGEEDSVKEEHAELIEETRAAIEATEETA